MDTKNNILDNESAQLPAGWVVKKLGEHCKKIASGATPTGGNDAYQKTGISLIRSQNIHDFAFSYNGLAFINEQQANKLKNVEVQQNDVLLNITGDSVARCCSVPYNILPARVNQHVMIIRPDEHVFNSKFLQYYLLNKATKEYLLTIAASGATRNALTKSHIEKLDIISPDIEKQKEIAAILSSLDDKIELNQQINKKLEEVAQAIFKEWFIDFNFPDENGNPYRDSSGAMVDSELGFIPASWSVGKLGHYVDIVGGGTPSTKNEKFWVDGTIHWATPKDLSVNKDVFLKGTLKKITTDGLKEISSGLLQPKTLLLSSRAPIGYLAVSNVSLAINQGYIAILPTSKYDTLFLYIWLKNNMEQVNSMANGSTFQEISKKSFKMIDIMNYPAELVDKYLDIVSQLFEQINLLETEILNLQGLRDTLLPKLMSEGVIS